MNEKKDEKKHLSHTNLIKFEQKKSKNKMHIPRHKTIQV